MINPDDILDRQVREWYEKNVREEYLNSPSGLPKLTVKNTVKRRWLMPVWNSLIEREHYIPWVFREIISSDPVFFLTIDNSVDGLTDRLKNTINRSCQIITADADITPSDFVNILNKNDVNSFFSHANFSHAVLMMRRQLLSQPLFNQVLPVWHEGGFLRHVCFQLDWMGWNALSSLAELKVEHLSELSSDQREFLRYFMNEMFIRNKIHYTRRSRFFTCSESVKQFFNTTQLLAVIPLQVHRDSVVVQFADEKYISLSWAFQFAEDHLDCFFVIIDHPLQRNFDHVPEYPTGPNWVYVPHDTGIDTTSLCRHADAVVTVNSTVAFEALYWTPVFRAGRSVYSHDLVTSSIENFPHTTCSQDDIEQFLYYAITQFHYTPQVNCDTQREWISVLEKNRYDYCSLISTIQHKKPPLLENLKTDALDFSFLTIPQEKNVDRIRAADLAEHFVDEIPPYSEILDIGGGSDVFAQFLYEIKRSKTTIVDIQDIKCTDLFASSVKCDFAQFSVDRRFDGLWASHILEHVTNIGVFLKQMIKYSKERAIFGIAVPRHNSSLVGGHINIFSPATLCYNVILAEQDLKNATILIDSINIALLWKRNDFELPVLRYDKGDIETLQDRFPVPVSQGVDAFAEWERESLI